MQCSINGDLNFFFLLLCLPSSTSFLQQIQNTGVKLMCNMLLLWFNPVGGSAPHSCLLPLFPAGGAENEGGKKQVELVGWDEAIN